MEERIEKFGTGKKLKRFHNKKQRSNHKQQLKNMTTLFVAPAITVPTKITPSKIKNNFTISGSKVSMSSPCIIYSLKKIILEIC